MDNVTKARLVDNIYKNSSYERQTIQDVVDAFMDELKAQLIDGNTIELRGFGTFKPRLRKGRDEARNPKTGEKCSMPPHYVGVFVPGQEIKESLAKLPVDENAEK